MQSRELPRIVSAEATTREGPSQEKVSSRTRFARLDFVRTTRRLDWFRLVLTFLLVGTGLWITGYFGWWAIRNAVDWLHDQPKYQLPFNEIQLVPAAPDWILGGDRTVLQGILKNAEEDSVLSVPSLEPGRLTQAFKKSPWVSEEQKIRFGHPNQVVVELRYRRPIAAVECASERLVVLDEEGVILPNDQIDLEVVSLARPTGGDAKALIRIVRNTKSDPKDRSPGITWRTNPIDAPLTESDQNVLSAARLAGFFVRETKRPTGPATAEFRVNTIYTNDGDVRNRGLFVKAADSVLFQWGPAPDEEVPGTPTAQEKWTMMRDWADSQPRPRLPKNDDYWKFQKSGLEVVRTSS